MVSNSKTLKAVVTGGAGFIGSHIAGECVKRGWQVTIIDNLSIGRIENIQHLLGTQKSPSSPFPETYNLTLKTYNSCDFIQGSITDLSLLQKTFAGADYVFHQAAIPSVPRSIDDPVASYEANVTGTLNVLIAARDNKVKKLVFASSSAIYGDTPQEYKKEDALPQPQSPYAADKLAAEYYCSVFSQVYNLPTACLRYFNVYGPRQSPLSDYAAVIPKFIDRINHNKKPIIYGDGLQTRDFVAVQDVVQANLLAAETDATGPYNIGSGEKTSLNKLVEILILLTGRTDLRAVYENPRPGDIKHSLADISKAQSIGYAPYYTLTNALRQLMGIKLMQDAPLGNGNPQAYSLDDRIRR